MIHGLLQILKEVVRTAEPPRLALMVSLCDLGMLNGPDFIALTNGLPGRNLDATGLHCLRQLALQFDLEQALVEGSALHHDVIGEVETALKRATCDAVEEVFTLVLLFVRTAGHD